MKQAPVSASSNMKMPTGIRMTCCSLVEAKEDDIEVRKPQTAVHISFPTAGPFSCPRKTHRLPLLRPCLNMHLN